MANEIELSVIYVNFNTHKFLKNSITSIISGDFPLDLLEIIVVDNNSFDESIDSLKNFMREQKAVSIKLIQNKRNLGFAKANNQAINESRGKYILFLNPDTLVSKNTLVRMVEFMKKNKKAGVATCRVLLPTGEIDDASHRGFPTPWNAFCHFGGLSLFFPKSLIFNGYHLGYRDLDKTHEIDSCAGAFMLVRKEAGEKIGWFDEDYFWYGEDLDFCYRMKKAGWKIMFVPNESIIHLKGVSSGIKDHSREISTATAETKLVATRARFEVMRIFYQKHYREIYPAFLTKLVLAGIKLKENLVMFKYYLCA